MSNGDYLTRSGKVLTEAFCSGSLKPLQDLVGLYLEWAEAGAFIDLDLEAANRAERESLDAKPGQNDGISKVNSDTLVFRETIADFMVAWWTAKTTLSTIKPEQIATIEAWLLKLVEGQAFALSASPIDCPAFDQLVSPVPRQLNKGAYMRWDQFDECINVGTSRAGVSALWAAISGDRQYALDALNTYVMTLHLQRQDGSNILESPREDIAHYKSVYNVAWMVVVAEVFAKQGVDLYDVAIDDRTILDAMEFLAKSVIDTDLIQHYAVSREGQQPIEFKDPWHWIVLTRFPDSKAAQLVKRSMAATPHREHLQLKLFNLFDPRPKTQMSRDALLPFTMLYVPQDFLNYAPQDTRLALEKAIGDRPDRCPNMGWTEADEVRAGSWWFTWSITNINGPTVEPQGVDTVVLKSGKGTITRFGTRNPRLRETFDIAYGSKGICIAGIFNLFDPDPTYPIRMMGSFDDGRVTGEWPDGDIFDVELKPYPY
jgi:hypothetical protein